MKIKKTKQKNTVTTKGTEAICAPAQLSMHYKLLSTWHKQNMLTVLYISEWVGGGGSSCNNITLSLLLCIVPFKTVIPHDCGSIEMWYVTVCIYGVFQYLSSIARPLSGSPNFAWQWVAPVWGIPPISYYQCRASDIEAVGRTFNVFSYGAVWAEDRTHNLPMSSGHSGSLRWIYKLHFKRKKIKGHKGLPSKAANMFLWLGLAAICLNFSFVYLKIVIQNNKSYTQSLFSSLAL